MPAYKNKCKIISFVFLVLYTIFISLKIKTNFDVDKFNSRIILKTSEELKLCGSDNYILSYISFKDSFFKKEFRFVEQLKLIKNSNGELEPVSVKFRNGNWADSYTLDDKSYIVVREGVKKPIYFDDLNKLKGYSSFIDLIEKSMVKPKEVAFVSVKGGIGIKYIFIIVNTNEEDKSCGKEQLVKILSNLQTLTMLSTKKLL